MRAAGTADQLVIVSGGAKGVDSYAESWAIRNYVPTEIFRADWERYGRSAGPRRNHEIVAAADMVVAFTTGSKGTAHTIGLTEEAGKPLKVYFIDSEGTV